MTESTKRKTLFLLGLLLIIIIIVASSLPQMELEPGMPMPKLDNDQMVIEPSQTETFEKISINRFFIILLLLLAAGSLLFGIIKLLRGANWKSLGFFIRPVLVICLILGVAFFVIMLLPKGKDTEAMELIIPTPAPPVTAPLGPVPPLLLWLVGFGILATGAMIGIWIFRSSSNQANTLDLVGLEAENAWQDIKIGVGLKDVIIKCYRKMSLALEKEQRIERKDFMTTRDFEKLLQAVGIPNDPIHQLTQLFEAARYGDWQPNPQDEQKAINCLEAIVLFSREAKEKN